MPKHAGITACIVSGLLALVSMHAQADMFDQARKAINPSISRRDSTGVGIRGGVNLQTGQAPNSTTILRGQATTEGGCSSISYLTSMKESFEEMPEALEALGGRIVENLPLLILAYTSPSIADLVKHLQAMANVIVQARYSSCQSIQNSMLYAGSRLRGGETSRCLSDQVNAGIGIAQAMRICDGDVGLLHTPDGGRRDRVDLVQETMAAAGASVEAQTLARSLLGEVTLRAQGRGLGHSQDRPQAALLARYEAHKAEADAAVRAAVEEFRTTGTVSVATLQNISVPGQSVPMSVVQGLAMLQQDQVRYENLLGKMDTGLAVTRLVWDCHEISEQLAASTEANSELTDAQRTMLRARLEGLERDLAAVLQKKDIVERHLQPTMNEVLSEFAAMQQAASQAGLRAPTRGTPAMPYRAQTPLGYGQ